MIANAEFKSCVLSALSVIGCLSYLAAGGPAVGAEPPRMLLQGSSGRDAESPSGTPTRFAILRLPDGSFAFYDQASPSDEPLSLPDRSGERYLLRPVLPHDIAARPMLLTSGLLANTQVVLTPERELLSVFVRGEKLDRREAAEAGLPRLLNVWSRRTEEGRVREPAMIWRGYNGSQMEYQQLAGGRVLVPYGSFRPHAKAVPPTGRHETIIQYSDDGGRSWRESKSKLVAPCYPGFNGSNEGACEPAIEQREDGRVWMLMRTQAGFLYESFSDDDGATWSPAAASRFHTSTGPPNIVRHENGWLVVCWNNCEMPPRHEGQGVYGGRDALHIAVSDDDGRTWRGFREIYLDHRRNDNPARSGDRGTAYPLGAYDADGNLIVLAGQGEGGRNPIVVDPAWIVETRAADDFSAGLARWSVYKHHGPAKRWWRARAVGCRLTPHPADPESRCLHVRKPDSLPADGAVWNFPNAWKGTLRTRVMLREGSSGGSLSLNDRFFDPTNDYGERFAVFQIRLTDADRKRDANDAVLQPGRWSDLRLQWDLSKSRCRVFLDDKPLADATLRHPTLNGLSYLRFRSLAKDRDPAGFLVDHVEVTVDDPYAPACTAQQQREQERRYVENVVPLWQQDSGR